MVDVQKMIEQEVHSAVEQTEAKLECLLEKVQQMESEMEYESAIHNLQAHIDRVKMRGDAALAYIRKLGINGTQDKKQQKSSRPSPAVTATVNITRSDSENEIVSHMDKKRRENHGELFQRTMETTKAALKKMRTDNEALKAAIADLKTTPSALSHSGSPVSPQSKRAARSMKTEAEEKVEEQKADRMKVKRLSGGNISSPEHMDTEKETTKAALKKMHTDNEALKAAIADLKTEPPPPPLSHSSSLLSPQSKRATRSMKAEAEEKVEEQKADRMKVKRLSGGNISSPEHMDTEKETTKAALKKMHTDNEALKAAIADLKTEPPPPPLSHSSSLLSPQSKRATRSMKAEAEEKVEEQKADRMKVKRLSGGNISSPEHMDTEKDEILYPPLPTMPFPSFLNMEAASYNIPQRPRLQLALIRNPPGVSVLWNMEEDDPSAPPMDSYSIFMAVEKVKGSGVFPEWKTLGEVTAIPLPMCVMVSKYKPGYKACFTVVGKDKFGRYGPYSRIVPATIPE